VQRLLSGTWTSRYGIEDNSITAFASSLSEDVARGTRGIWVEKVLRYLLFLPSPNARFLGASFIPSRHMSKRDAMTNIVKQPCDEGVIRSAPCTTLR